MDSNIEKLKEEIIKSLKPLNPYRVILFGSYAYGKPTQDSDVDICILENGDISKRELKSRVREALKGIKIPKDILVEEYDYFMKHSDENWINTALYDIRHRGIILYENRYGFV